MEQKLTGVELIAQERKEQIEKHYRSEWWDKEQNAEGQLLDAARMLLLEDTTTVRHHPPKGWSKDIWMKMCLKPLSDRMIISAALIAAEYDRVG